jgi:hypothetical protein
VNNSTTTGVRAPVAAACGSLSTRTVCSVSVKLSAPRLARAMTRHTTARPTNKSTKLIQRCIEFILSLQNSRPPRAHKFTRARRL